LRTRSTRGGTHVSQVIRWLGRETKSRGECILNNRGKRGLLEKHDGLEKRKKREEREKQERGMEVPTATNKGGKRNRMWAKMGKGPEDLKGGRGCTQFDGRGTDLVRVRRGGE